MEVRRESPVLFVVGNGEDLKSKTVFLCFSDDRVSYMSASHTTKLHSRSANVHRWQPAADGKSAWTNCAKACPGPPDNNKCGATFPKTVACLYTFF